MAIGPANSPLDALTISRLGDLKLRARTMVEGALAGLHRSPHHGASVEFAEHKEYSPGDEIRNIDWKAYGKFDKYYVKRFEEETELRAYLAIDCSASMGYAGTSVTKLTYAGYLAAAIAYLLLRQQDQAGLIAFAEGVDLYLPPRARTGQLADLLDAITQLTPHGATHLEQALSYVSSVVHRRSLIVLFSDLFEGQPQAMRMLRGLRAHRHDVVLFHILDEDELVLPEARFPRPTRFVGLEDQATVDADPRVVRRHYIKEIQRFTEDCRRACIEGSVEYHLVSTARPPSEVLLRFLRHRVHVKAKAR